MGSIVTPVYWKKDAAGQLRQLPFISGLNLNPTAGISSIYGGDTANDDLKLYANSSDARSYIAINGANDIQCSIHTGTQFVIDEVGNNFMSFDRSGSTYTTDATTTTAWDFNFNTITSGVGAVMSSNNCAGGIILKIVGDSDALTTGELIGIYGGTAKDKSWFAVIENSSDTEGSQVIIDGDNVAGDPAKPSLRIGTGEQGFYPIGAGTIATSIGGAVKWYWGASSMRADPSGAFNIVYTAATATAPAYTFVGDTDTGVGRAAADHLSLISAGIEAKTLTSAIVTTSDATLTTCGSLTLTDNIAYKVKAHVVAVDTTGTPSVKRGCWEFVGCFYRTNAGNATQQGNTQSLVQIRDEIGSLWDADFAVSGNDVRIRVNGEAGVDVNWKTTIEYMRVGE